MVKGKVFAGGSGWQKHGKTIKETQSLLFVGYLLQESIEFFL